MALPDSDSSSRPPKLLDQLRDRIRVKHYSIRTEQAYVQWVKRYLFFHGMRHPNEMGKPEVEAFLTSLAVERNVAASTQGQALAAVGCAKRTDRRVGAHGAPGDPAGHLG